MRIFKSLFAIVVASLLAFSSCTAAPKASTLRVLYWNIQNGMWDSQGENYDSFIKWINEQKPDICIFCEAASIYKNGTSERAPKEENFLPDGWGKLIGRYGHKHWALGKMRDSYPQVVTSRYPIKTLWTSGGDDADTLVVHGCGLFEIDVPGLAKAVKVVTLHPKPFMYGRVPKEEQAESAARFEGEKFRLKEVQYICNHTVRQSQNLDKDCYIMAADYNSRSPRDNAVYQKDLNSDFFLTQNFMLNESGLVDAVSDFYPGEFCYSAGEKSRIDYFYTTKAVYSAIKAVTWKPDSYTLRKSTGISNFYRPSDHYPIIVDIDLNKLNKALK